MYSTIKTAALWGLKGESVRVETDLLSGLPGLVLVGLPNQSVKESGERVKSAMLNCGLGFPGRKIVVNLSPADRRKDGSHFDLPIAAGILCAFGKLTQEAVEDFAMIGELSLNGQIRGVKGALPLILALRDEGCKKVILPLENAEEVSQLKDMELYGALHLHQVVEHLSGKALLKPLGGEGFQEEDDPAKEDFLQVRGQEIAKRCVVLACAGMHGLLMNGSPGVGKTMIARRIPTVLPQLNYDEMLEVTGIYSAAGALSERKGRLRRSPFRAPHYGISAAAMIGGGQNPRPGEASLAHHGVLFLDELPLFDTRVLELLRTPLETGSVNISRAKGTCVFPSRFLLAAAANPCPCGYYGDPRRSCRCTAFQLERYRKKLSGPLLDRMDLQIYLNTPGRDEKQGMSSAQMREEIQEIRSRQAHRYRNTGILYNSQLTPGLIEQYCVLEKEAKGLLYQYMDRFLISMRAKDRILKSARTIADSAASENIRVEHLAEALQYRGGWDRGKEIG